MLVREIMETCSAECTEDTPLEQVYKLIQECEDRFVVVVDSKVHRVPIGVVTEHTICEQIINKGRNPKSLTAGSVMDSRIVKVGTDNIADGLSNMADEKRTVPFIVVNDRRELCGVLQPQKLHRHQFYSAPARDAQISAMQVPELPAFGWA